MKMNPEPAWQTPKNVNSKPCQAVFGSGILVVAKLFPFRFPFNWLALDYYLQDCQLKD